MIILPKRIKYNGVTVNEYDLALLDGLNFIKYEPLDKVETPNGVVITDGSYMIFRLQDYVDEYKDGKALEKTQFKITHNDKFIGYLNREDLQFLMKLLDFGDKLIEDDYNESRRTC